MTFSYERGTPVSPHLRSRDLSPSLALLSKIKSREERIFIELMLLDSEYKASREGSK